MGTVLAGTTIMATKLGQGMRSESSDFPTSDPQVFLRVSTFFHRKCYLSQAVGVRRLPGSVEGVFSAELYAPMSAVRVSNSQPVGRFSGKGLHSEHERAIRLVCEMFGALGGECFADVLAEVPVR